MANIYAVKSGNWSDPTVWNTGALPTNADAVFANGFSVTVDISPTVFSISNNNATGIIRGGNFILTNAVTLTCTAAGAGIIGNVQGTGAVNFGLTAGESATVIGNLAILTASAFQYAVMVFGAGTLNIIGNIQGPSGGPANPLYISVPATVNLTGNVDGGRFSSSYAIYIGAAATLNVTGTLTSSTAPCIFSTTNGCSITINGQAEAAQTPAISLSGTATLVLNGTATASNAASAVVSSSASATNIFTGPLINNAGQISVQAYKMFMKSEAPISWTFTTEDLLTDRTLYSADSVVGTVHPSDVRAGVQYGVGFEITGAMAVPPAASVAFGVPVDATTGTAALSPEDIWSVQMSAITAPGSIGKRLKNVATAQTVGAQVAALT